MQITFTQQSTSYVGEVAGVGRAVIQVQRKGKGNLELYQFIPDMPPILFKDFSNAAENVLINVDVPKEMKIRIVSATEVEKCMMVSIPEVAAPSNALTANDIVNDLTTGGATKVLSAEQGKALKGLIPVAATTGKGGTVKQMAKIDDISTETGSDLKEKINAILAGMKTAGIMANS